MAGSNPCSPDCRSRSPTCHGECEKYLAFHEAMKTIHKRNYDQMKLTWYQIDAKINCAHKKPLLMRKENNQRRHSWEE